MTHELKADPLPFSEVLAGRKLSEVRVNDRDYRAGDTLHLREFDRETQTYTGRECRVQVLHVQTGYGLPEHLVVMSVTGPADQLARLLDMEKTLQRAGMLAGVTRHIQAGKLYDGSVVASVVSASNELLADLRRLGIEHCGVPEAELKEPVENPDQAPVRCTECGWLGYANELGSEGECGGEGCHGTAVVPISGTADMIDAWLDSEGAICGKELADAGMIEPQPATAEEAERLDLKPGDTVWALSAAGNAELAAKKAAAAHHSPLGDALASAGHTRADTPKQAYA